MREHGARTAETYAQEMPWKPKRHMTSRSRQSRGTRTCTPLGRQRELDRGGFAYALGGPAGTRPFITAAEWRGITESQTVTPGTGQVLITEVGVPGVGWP
ncbi:hypothetical protein [Acrocarpospora sp. B8E8]|uniref:hypothetical protein n=1 Tax=Acrocarpospora sp. B8E8 TaxID=3153572 RepID=UPI00325DC534